MAEEQFINNESCIKHTVEDRESIIQILRKYSLYPIFGNNGSLSKTYKINNRESNLKKDLIHKGDILCLPLIKKGEQSLKAEFIKPPKKSIPLNSEYRISKNFYETKFNDKCTKYTVKKGETIIKILKNNSLYPVFGKDGSLLRTLKINNREGKNGHIIHKGSILCLPEKEKTKNTILLNKDTNSQYYDDNNLHINHDFSALIEYNYKYNNNFPEYLDKKMSESKISEDKYDNLNVNIQKTQENKLNKKVNNKNKKDKNAFKKIETSVIKENPLEDINDLKRNDISDIKRKKKKNNLNQLNNSYKNNITNKKCNKYIASEGESLIQILRSKFMTPIYGVDGSLDKTLQLNPNLPINNDTFKGGEILCLVDTTNQEDQNNPIKENTNIITDQNKYQNDSKNFQIAYVEGGSRYLKLSEKDASSGTSATLLSRMIISAETGLIQKWYPHFQSYFGINYAVSQIMQSDTSVVIGDNIIRLTNFFSGAKYQFLPYAYGQMELGYGDELIFRAVSSQTIQVEKMSTAKLKFLGGITMHQYGSFDFNGELAYLLNMPFNNQVYSSQVGMGYEGALVSVYQGIGWDFRARLYYTNYKTNVPPVVFNYAELGFLLRLAVDLPN